jgi:hypothetical protein
MFNLITFIEGLFGVKPPSTAPKAPIVQTVVDQAGAALDTVETALATLQSLAPQLPQPYSGLLAAAAVTFHTLDAYVDTIETQPAVPVPPAQPS